MNNNRPLYYILDWATGETTPVDLKTWIPSFVNKERHVARTNLGDAEISTVFLGIDHGYLTEKPILFETMIFGGIHDGYQNRCCTLSEAYKMHDDAVDLVAKGNCMPYYLGKLRLWTLKLISTSHRLLKGLLTAVKT